jgi:hypothetical protein
LRHIPDLFGNHIDGFDQYRCASTKTGKLRAAVKGAVAAGS